MVSIAAWAIFALAIGHFGVGLIWYKKPLLAACREGFIGKFKPEQSRILAFWFMIFTPLMMMGGQIAAHAANTGDLPTLKIVGFYMLAVSIVGIAAFPKAPFWVALILSPVVIAGGYGLIQ